MGQTVMDNGKNVFNAVFKRLRPKHVKYYTYLVTQYYLFF